MSRILKSIEPGPSVHELLAYPAPLVPLRLPRGSRITLLVVSDDKLTRARLSQQFIQAILQAPADPRHAIADVESRQQFLSWYKRVSFFRVWDVLSCTPDEDYFRDLNVYRALVKITDVRKKASIMCAINRQIEARFEDLSSKIEACMAVS